jgi:hypothetical protein
MSSSHPARRAPRRRVFFAAALALLMAFPALAQGPDATRRAAEDFVPRDLQLRALKQLQRDMLFQGARRRMAAARARLREQQELKKRGVAPKRGVHVRKAKESEEGLLGPRDPERRVVMASVEQTAAVPTNVRVNNTAGDAATAGQAEESIASLGDYVLVAWNDGQGFVPPYGDIQTAGYSTDGGASFTKVAIPHPAGIASWVWGSDPIITVDEKRGRFYYCGMAGNDQNWSTTTYIGVAAAHFSGTTFTWDSAFVVRSESSITYFLDKPWCVADSATGNVYVTSTTFDALDHIDFYRSTNGGRTWSVQTQISLAGEDGAVQGSRPVVGPTGQLYAVWSSIGSTDADYLYCRRSTDQGLTWVAGEVLVASHFAQFGTGAPGYNRERGITFPSVTVDRTTGPNRGRIYVAWNETWDIISTSFPTSSSKSEVEVNNSAGNATVFTPGDILRGTCSYNTATAIDFDYYKFSLTAGQHAVFWADSFSQKATYTLRLFAAIPDSSQRLAFGGDLDSTGAITPSQAFYSFTAPIAGTYYLRMAPAYQNKSRPFNYRIRTAYGAGPGGYRARDQRDSFVRASNDGITWSAISRANDNAIGFDDFLAEVIVGADGCPYASWFDFRDDIYGSRANQYAARSLDAGASWQTNARFTSATSNFTTCSSNIAPNEGDYSHMYGDPRYVRPTWADGRGTNVDVWATSIDTWYTLTGCPSTQSVNPLDVVNLSWTVNNLNPLFANNYNYTLTSARNWSLPSPGTLSGVAASSSGNINLAVTVPDTVALGSNVLTMTVQNEKGTRVQQCSVTLNVVTTLLAVDPTSYGLALAPVRPNPAYHAARLDYTLPRNGRVKLVIYGLQGEVVRTLVDGEGVAGPNSAAWDGRDESGRAVAAGAYFARLEAFGRTLTQRMVWMR